MGDFRSRNRHRSRLNGKGSGSPSSMPSRAPPKGNSLITGFFTPAKTSPPKSSRKRQAENTDKCATMAAKKPKTTPEQQAPKHSPPQKAMTQKTAASTPPTSDSVSLCLGLLRTDSPHSAPTDVQLSSYSAIPLFPGAVLGRDARRHSTNNDTNKLKLEIPHKISGVSRKQLIVTALDANTVSFQQPTTVQNSSLALLFRRQKQNPRRRQVEAGGTITLRLGDVVVLDTHDKFAYRIVQLQPNDKTPEVQTPSSNTGLHASDASCNNLNTPSSNTRPQPKTAPNTPDTAEVTQISPPLVEDLTQDTPPPQDHSQDVVNEQSRTNDKSPPDVAPQPPASSTAAANDSKQTYSNKSAPDAAPKRPAATTAATKSKQTDSKHATASKSTSESMSRPPQTVATYKTNKGDEDNNKNAVPVQQAAGQATSNSNGTGSKSSNSQNTGPNTRATRSSQRRVAQQGRNNEKNTRKQSKASKTQRKRVPKKNGRLRVFFEAGTDAFGARKGAGGYYFATILGSTKREDGTYDLYLCYDDNTDGSAQYPYGTTVQLLAAPKNKNQRKIWVQDLTAPPELMAYDRNPEQLFAGDLVFVCYQNGQQQGAWYRGRVVSTDGTTCNVIYDDGEFEIGIPLGQTKISLVEHGSDNRAWMHGLEVKIPALAGTATILPSDSQGKDPVMVQVGTQSPVPLDYSTVALALMTKAERLVTKRFNWPGSSKPAEAPPESCDKLNLPSSSDRLSFGANSSEWTVDPVPSETTVSFSFRELDASSAKVMFQSLSSPEPNLGVELLTFRMEFHNEVPGPELAKNLILLLTYGPTSEGIFFPECNRINLAQEYVFQCLSKPGMGETFSRAAGPSYWKDFLEQMSRPIYCADGDEDRRSRSALLRVAQSLQVKASAAKLLARLLQLQLEHCIGNKMAIQKKIHRTKSLLRDVTKDGETGAKKALVGVLEVTMKILLKHGHGGLEHDGEEPDSISAVQFAHSQTMALLKHLGVICSYIAWIFLVENDNDVDYCSRTIRDVVTREITNSRLDLSGFLSIPKGRAGKRIKDAFWNKQKLRFVLNLDEKVVPELRPQLAQLLGVESLYSLFCIS